MYFCLAFEDDVDEAAAAAAAEAATADAAGVILNIGGRGKPPNRGWYLRGVCSSPAHLVTFQEFSRVMALDLVKMV